MTQIVLIRPGLTDYHEQRLIQGTLDVPLNEEGETEVKRLIKEVSPLGLEAVYVSDSEPALQTAEAIAEALDIKCRKSDRLRNLDHGLWQGMAIDEIRVKQPKVYRQWQDAPECVCPPQGETLEAADERVQAALAKIMKRHKGGVVGLVVAEPLASLVRRYFTHGQLGDLWQATQEHGNWERLSPAPAGASSDRGPHLQ
jgi:broad specificity phosphatase PhoE